VATYGWTRPHGDGASSWVVQGRTRSVVLPSGSSATHEAIVVAAPPTSTTTIEWGRGTRGPMGTIGGTVGGGGRDCNPLKVVKAIAESQVANTSVLACSHMRHKQEGGFIEDDVSEDQRVVGE
jgi:hypothetical protein